MTRSRCSNRAGSRWRRCTRTPSGSTTPRWPSRPSAARSPARPRSTSRSTRTPSRRRLPRPAYPLPARRLRVLVDAHAHLLPRDYPPDAPECFPRMEAAEADTARTLVFGPMRFRARDVFFDAERRVEEMAASGVDVEVVSPMPPLLRYDLPLADGLALARHVNEFAAELCSADPTRLIGLGMVPLQDPDAAAAELTAAQELGLRGVEIASNVLDTPIGDARFLPFFA